jgi:hypothetical protein
MRTAGEVIDGPGRHRGRDTTEWLAESGLFDIY